MEKTDSAFRESQSCPSSPTKAGRGYKSFLESSILNSILRLPRSKQISQILFCSDTSWPSTCSSGCWFDGILQGPEVNKDLLFYLRSYNVEGLRQMGVFTPFQRHLHSDTLVDSLPSLVTTICPSKSCAEENSRILGHWESARVS